MSSSSSVAIRLVRRAGEDAFPPIRVGSLNELRSLAQHSLHGAEVSVAECTFELVEWFAVVVAAVCKEELEQLRILPRMSHRRSARLDHRVRIGAVCDEDAGKLVPPVVRRAPQRVPTRCALLRQIRIGTVREQQLHHLDVVPPRGSRDGPLMTRVLEVCERPVTAERVLDERTVSAERREEDRVLRAGSEQNIRNRRPAPAALHQGAMNRPIAITANGVDSCPGGDETTDDLQVAAFRCLVQRGLARLVTRASEVRVAPKLGLDTRDVTFAGRLNDLVRSFSERESTREVSAQHVADLAILAVVGHGDQRLSERIGAIRRVGAAIEKEPNECRTLFAHREVNGRRVVVLVSRQRRVSRRERRHAREVAIARRGEHGPHVIRGRVATARQLDRLGRRELDGTDLRARSLAVSRWIDRFDVASELATSFGIRARGR